MLQRSPIGTPHNQYLNILVEFGIVGLVAWLVFLVAAWRTGLRIYRDATHPVHRSFALGWLGMFAGMVAGGVTGDFMIHSIRNGGIELFSGYYLQWVLLGGLVGDSGAGARGTRPRARRRATAALLARLAPRPAAGRRRRRGSRPSEPVRVLYVTDSPTVSGAEHVWFGYLPRAGPQRPRRPRLPERRQHPADRRARPARHAVHARPDRSAAG